MSITQERPSSSEQHPSDPNVHARSRFGLKERVGAAVALVAVVGGGYLYSKGTGGEERPAGQTTSDLSEPVEGALNVDGNTYPEKANPEFNEKYGITELSDQGQIPDVAEFYEKVGLEKIVVSDDEAAIMVTPDSELVDIDEGLTTKYGIDDKVLKNIETILNVYNMNNPTVKQTRALGEDMNEDQALLLQNADLQEVITTALNTPPSADQVWALQPDMLTPLIASVPNDASLRAVVCPIVGDIPQVCSDVQQQDASFSPRSESHDLIRNVAPNAAYTTEVPAPGIGKKYVVRTVWVDNQGEVASYNATEIRGLELIFGAEGSDNRQPQLWGIEGSDIIEDGYR